MGNPVPVRHSAVNNICLYIGKSMIKDGLKTDDLNPVVVVGDGSEDLLCSEGCI